MKSNLSDNEKVLLRLIALHQPVSRIELTKPSGLTAASVTRIVKGLINDGFISETGRVYGSRGQPSILLTLNPMGAYSFGVQFSQNQVTLMMTNLVGEEVGFETLPIPEASVTSICDTVNELTNKLIEAAGCDGDDILGYGIAVPGNFSTKPRRLLQHELFPLLVNCDIDTEFAERLNYPCWIENDATSAAIGVKQAHPSWQDFCLLHVGYGLGGGIFIDGNLYTGKHGNAGQFGALFPYDKDRPTGQDLFRHLQENEIDVKDFSELESFGADNLAIHVWIERAAKQLGEAILNVARIFDTTRIILGGLLPAEITTILAHKAEKHAQKLRTTEANYFPGPLPTICVVGSEMGKIGTAWLPIHRNIFA
ncbi:ROK family protein [Photobacterium sp. ZSDE20]|uniref:ROK family protein n=1 Tax=Photobacterium pectinilyticum TaxID=2906793 RepID=A0ABT1MYP6_9GAMM|nr:ROK family transcriptional regulator [Photobacterium sp. ZSDE20]MCQ1056636.1 ROK family protein [Photobacterium sp. ZSDE20]MDD1820771.1 ROK family protein [Photobacterium sp. ZSDE20]